MTLPTHMSGQFSGQAPNQPGSSLPAMPHQQHMMQNSVSQRGTLIMEPGLMKARRFIQEMIYDFLMQRQQTQEVPQKKVLDIVKRLEEGLFKTATSKEEYMNLETLETRLHVLIKRLPLNNHNQNQQYQRGTTSVAMGTMIPTPGTMIPTPGVSQTRNPSSTVQSSMVPAVHSGSFSADGGLTNGYEHAGVNSMISSMGAKRMASQMIPTPGFSNNNNNNGNAINTSNQSYVNMDSSNSNLGISGGGIRSSLKQKAYGVQNGSMTNLGIMSNSQMSHGDGNSQLLHGNSLNSGNFHGATTSGNMNPVSLQALHKTSSPLMIDQSNLKNNQQSGNMKPLVDQSAKMDFLQFQQQLQQNQRLGFGQSQMASDSSGQIKSEPGMESHIEGLQPQNNEQFQSSMAETSQQMQQHQFVVDSHNDLGSQQEEIHGQWDSYDPNVQEEFHQRITVQDQAQRNILEESANKTVNPPNSGATSQNPNQNRELQYVNQQRWLLFLRHARKCVHPHGKCPESNCVSAQKLWNHMASCKDLVQCQYPRCRGTKHLLRHHRNCQDLTCQVCVPVKRYLQQKGGIRTNSNPNPNPSSDSNSGLPSVVETSEDLHPSMKRIKIEPPSQSHSQTENENSGITIPVSGTVKVVEEHKGVVDPCVPIKSEVETDVPLTSVQKSESVPILSNEATGFKKEVVKTENEVVPVKLEDPEASGTKSGKPKIKGVSMMELFTPEQIREHIAGLRQWVGQSKAKVEKNQAMESLMNENSCQLCAVEKLNFEPPPIYCTPCGARIKRNAIFYTIGTGDTRHFFCIPCYNETRGDTINVDGRNILKARMEKKKNDEVTEEWWVQCDKCEAWQHQICALFNGKRNEGGQAEYTCPNCYIEEVERGERIPLPQSAVLGAKDLPRTILSDHIENRLFKRLKQERTERARFHGKSYDEVPGAESLVVRVVSSVDKKLEVKPRFLEIFQEENYPKEFGYKSKVVLLFQKIEGVEVCLFGMYVQEFGTECEQPNDRRVYLSYLDSVKYFRPDIKTVTGEALRTFVYHEILIGYLEYCKLRGFTSCYIWACPPLKGEDYILYCHPEIQKTPKSDKLREWYLAMLLKATKENIVAELTNLYDHFFLSSGECKAKVTAARLPYFDGDYWPGAAEDIIYQLRQEEDGRKSNKKGPIKKTITKRALKASGQTDFSGNVSKDLLLMQKLGESISPMKEDFIMVHLQPSCTHCCHVMVSGKRWVCHQCKNFRLCDRCHEIEQKLNERERHPINHREKHPLYPIEISDVPTDTKDKDEILESEFFDTRQAFLSLCQGNHYQYDTLRRAKHSSMMLLYHLHNPTAPAFVTSCNRCHLDIETGQGWRCEVCPDFDVCNSCYYKDGGINHPHKLTNHPSIAERDAQNTEARQQRVLQLRKMLDLLVHASKCRSPICRYPNCRKVKGLFRHGINCKTRASGGCVLCTKMWYLLQLHARACKESQCHVPRCRDLNEHLRRLQQQSDNRRRAAVTEMMRQRAAEVASGS